MTVLKPGRKKSKNPPYFSHEYIITNHGDIVSFIAMIFVLGLMFKVTAPIASLFIVLHHNVTLNETNEKSELLYTPGRKDVFVSVFYTLICIVVHAVIQEYGLDKLNRKLHLSKVKHSKFNESGQLAIFYLVSAVWGANIIYTENYVTDLSRIWDTYPHLALPFWVKFYFMCQLCYWLHGYPELYFQKIKRDEIPPRIIYTSLYLMAVLAAYALNLTRLGLILLVVHYTVEFIFHTSRLLYFAGKTQFSNFGFMLWNALFVVARVICTTLGYVTFCHGLEHSSRTSVNLAEGNFNTKIIRLNCLAFILLVQVFMMWNFINFHLRRLRERGGAAGSVIGSSSGTTVTAISAGSPSSATKRRDKKKVKKEEEDLNDLPEADQNQQKELRQRKGGKA